MMLLNTVSTMTSECFFVRSDTRDTSSTSSALVMLPPGIFKLLSLSVPEVIAQRRRPGAFALRVRLKVRTIVVRLERADAQADLPLLRAQLDDLHLVVAAHFEVDLLAAVRVVELRYVNEPFDALVELDERAEVGHARDLPFDRVADVMA